MNYAYEVVTVGGKRVFAHQTVLPKKDGVDIDHINGDKRDNRPENLRYLPRELNALHRQRPEAGVDYMETKGKWRVRVGTKHIGMYTTKDDAVAARAQAVSDKIQEWTNE